MKLLRINVQKQIKEEKENPTFRGFRSSLPIVWVNGKCYQMTVGDSVAFPSGTGMAHTLLNETSEEVELLVSAETTKKTTAVLFFRLILKKKSFVAFGGIKLPYRKWVVILPCLK